MKKNKKRKPGKPRRKRPDKSRQMQYDYHLPVFLQKVCDLLVTKNDGIYVDGTLGGGGHAFEILKRLESGGFIYAFDKDPEAINHCKLKFSSELSASPPRIKLVNQCYSKACGIEEIKGKVDGFLLDLGVSSRQLDSDSIGLSYRIDSNLDMRFGTEGRTAEEFLHAAKEEELEQVLRKYGEEPFSGKIARRIVERRRAAPVKTTFQLRMIVEESVPPHLAFKSLSRVFQALRIAVNAELEVLEDTLTNIIPILAPGGRIVVLSYHSLEDRIVKNIFKDNRLKKSDRDSARPALRIITPKPIVPGHEETGQNPRARSAKLRAAERV